MLEGGEILRAALGALLEERKSRNPAYSLRSLAKQVEMSPAALSGFLKGKRGIGRVRADRVADRIQLAPELRQRMRVGLGPRRLPTDPSAYTTLDSDIYETISEWYHFAILSLVETEDFDSSPAWIAKRLGLKTPVVQSAIDRLLLLGLLEMRGTRLAATHKEISSPDGIANAALRRAHTKNLELAFGALMDTPFTHRDFSAITIAMDPDELSQARKLLRLLRDSAAKKLESGRRKEVYKLCLQLFPLTKVASQEPLS